MLAPSVRGRVAYYSTRYRRDHDREGRGWITVEGVQVLDMSTLYAWAGTLDTGTTGSNKQSQTGSREES